MYKVWWMKKENNYGDLLTPYIFDYFDIPYVYSSAEDANTLCIGSIAAHAKENTIVLGSGIIKQKQQPHPKAIYKFVRGPLTRKKVLDLGGYCPPIYGDAATLLPLFWKESAKEYDVGIIPHIWHYNEAKEKYPDYKIIDLTKDPKEVTEEITKCKKIISSSLHGIIVSHAYNIPAAWTTFSKKLAGDNIKFKDYYASIDLPATISTVEDPIYSLQKTNTDPMINIFKELRENSNNGY